MKQTPRRATRLWRRRLPRRHARPGLRPAVRLLVRRLPQAVPGANIARPMPKGVTWDEDWDRMLEFRYRSSQRFEQALRDHVKSLNPAGDASTSTITAIRRSPGRWASARCSTPATATLSPARRASGASAARDGRLNAEFYRAATPGCPSGGHAARRADVSRPDHPPA